jgi:hypothetical protein
MTVNNGKSAREWAQSWITAARSQEPNVRRFQRVAAEQDRLASMCGDRQPTARAGHLEAATVLRQMAVELQDAL